MKQQPVEKALNDYLFAPTRYLDKDGHGVNVNPLHRLYSAPESKAGVLFGTGTALTMAASGAPLLFSIYPLVAGVVSTTSNYIRPEKTPSMVRNLPEYYFDTNPERHIPLNNPHIHTDLVLKRASLRSRLLASTITSTIMFPIMMGVNSVFVSDPLTNLKITSIFMGVSTAINFTSKIATAWRADQTLKGNWNVIMRKPERETARSLVTSPLATSPAANIR